MVGKSGNLIAGGGDKQEKFSEFEVEWNPNWQMSVRCPELSLTKQISVLSSTKSVLVNIVDHVRGPQLEVYQNTKEFVR